MNINIKTEDDYSPMGDCDQYDIQTDDELTGDGGRKNGIWFSTYDT